MQVEAVREILEHFGEVRLAYVFGSVAVGTARTSSDLNVAVLLTPDAGHAVLDRLTDALERASGRSVDLVDLSLAPPLLAHEVVSRGKLILSRDEAERVEFVTRAVARYLDTAHFFRSTRRRHAYARGCPCLGKADQQLQWAIERGLHIAAEALFDAGNHILAAEFQESVDEYKEIPKRLASRVNTHARSKLRLVEA